MLSRIVAHCGLMHNDGANFQDNCYGQNKKSHQKSKQKVIFITEVDV